MPLSAFACTHRLAALLALCAHVGLALAAQRAYPALTATLHALSAHDWLAARDAFLALAEYVYICWHLLWLGVLEATTGLLAEATGFGHRHRFRVRPG